MLDEFRRLINQSRVENRIKWVELYCYTESTPGLGNEYSLASTRHIARQIDLL